MSNRFKDFKKTKSVTLTQEELEKYSNTVGNAGVDHSKPEWEVKDAPAETVDTVERDDSEDKTRTIEREGARELKAFEKKQTGDILL